MLSDDICMQMRFVGVDELISGAHVVEQYFWSLVKRVKRT